LEDRGVDWRIILKWNFKKQNGARSIHTWLEIWISGGHLQMRWLILGFHKMWRIFLSSRGTLRFSRRNLLHAVINCKHAINCYTGIENCVTEKFQLKKKHNELRYLKPRPLYTLITELFRHSSVSINVPAFILLLIRFEQNV
jgi:hypothetical protein